MGNWDKKNSMAERASSHTLLMSHKYAEDIEYSVKNSKIYNEENVRETTTSCIPSTIRVQDFDTVSAALFCKNLFPDKKICVLNFASYKNPGGKFMDGSSAQEESICHESDLYNVLKRFDNTYYAPHRQKGAANRSLYNDEAIYSPDITFTHQVGDTDSKIYRIFKADVLTCAAPNWTAAKAYHKVTLYENLDALVSRIQFIKNILEQEKVEVAILGAFGCGVFGQDPTDVAKIFNKTFSNSTISSIVYAVPAGLNRRNYNAFKTYIKEK
jgi:uncharacterized protein (TIGR02452 family)